MRVPAAYATRESFEFQQQLGHGGFAEVYLVKKRTRTNPGIDDQHCSFACKILPKRKLLETRLDALQREQLILRNVWSPFFANLHYIFQDTRWVYLVMDLCNGGDLASRLEQIYRTTSRGMDEVSVRFVAINVAMALQDLHARNVAHRDIKPENLLLDGHGYVRLTDFGIAVPLNEAKFCFDRSGTRVYLAPEVFGDPLHRHGKPVDFFALGVTLYQLLTAERPFAATNRMLLQILAEHSQMEFRRGTFEDLLTFRRRVNQALYDTIGTNWHSALMLRAGVSAHCADFVTQLMICNPMYRLGFERGAQELLEHPWMEGIALDRIRSQEAKSPLMSIDRVRRMRSRAPEVDHSPELTDLEQAVFRGIEFAVTPENQKTRRDAKTWVLDPRTATVPTWWRPEPAAVERQQMMILASRIREAAEGHTSDTDQEPTDVDYLEARNRIAAMDRQQQLGLRAGAIGRATIKHNIERVEAAAAAAAAAGGGEAEYKREPDLEMIHNAKKVLGAPKSDRPKARGLASQSARPTSHSISPRPGSASAPPTSARKIHEPRLAEEIPPPIQEAVRDAMARVVFYGGGDASPVNDRSRKPRGSLAMTPRGVSLRTPASSGGGSSSIGGGSSSIPVTIPTLQAPGPEAEAEAEAPRLPTIISEESSIQGLPEPVPQETPLGALDGRSGSPQEDVTLNGHPGGSAS